VWCIILKKTRILFHSRLLRFQSIASLRTADAEIISFQRMTPMYVANSPIFSLQPPTVFLVHEPVATITSGDKPPIVIPSIRTFATMMCLSPRISRPIFGLVAFLLATVCVYVHEFRHFEIFGTASSLQESVLEPIDICFISSIFGPSVKTADRPHDFTNYAMSNTTSFQFFLCTNLEDLATPGWTKVVRNFSYRRFITQSRWGKFMA
jgi:hypothetical protein